MKLLFIASDPMEFRGLLAHATAVREAEVAAHWSRRATLGANEALLVANGAGPNRAAAATDAGMKAFDAAAIVSTGFCGALAPEIEIADLVSATCVETKDRSYATSMWDRPPGLFAGQGHALPAANGAVITNRAQARHHHVPRHFSG